MCITRTMQTLGIVQVDAGRRTHSKARLTQHSQPKVWVSFGLALEGKRKLAAGCKGLRFTRTVSSLYTEE